MTIISEWLQKKLKKEEHERGNANETRYDDGNQGHRGRIGGVVEDVEGGEGGVVDDRRPRFGNFSFLLHVYDPIIVD